MRVAIDARKIADYGIGTYIRGLVGALATLRPNDDFVLIGNAAAAPELAHDNVTWVADDSPRYGLRELRQIAQRVREIGADVFHAPHYTYPIGLHCPGVVTIHDCIHLRFPAHLPRPAGFLPRGLSRWYAWGMLRHATRAAHAILTVSNSTRSDLVRLAGADRARIRVTPNGCDPYWLEPHAPEPKTGTEILWVGNAKPHKNLPRLLQAFQMLRTRGHGEARLRLVGSIDSAIGAHRHAGVDVSGRVELAELRRLYRRATVFCLPSLHEGFGLPALEAMACATPVVAGDAGGLPEVVGDAGILVDPTDATSIAEGLASLVEDPDRAARLGVAGRERARQFCWLDAALGTAEAYAEALRSSS